MEESGTFLLLPSIESCVICNFKGVQNIYADYISSRAVGFSEASRALRESALPECPVSKCYKRVYVD